MTIYYALTNQERDVHGAVDMYPMSHLPLETVNKLLQSQRDVPYFQKIQILLKQHESVAWLGSTFHGVHENTSDVHRYSMYYVLKVKKFGNSSACDIVEQKIPQCDLEHYKQNFKWIYKPSELEQWMKETQTVTVSDIQKTIDRHKLFQFVCVKNQ